MLRQSEATLAWSVLSLPHSFSRWLPPSSSLSVLFSPSPFVIVVLQKAGGGVFTEKEVRPIGGQEHLCAVSQKPLTVLHTRQPRSHSSSLSLSQQRACLRAVFSPPFSFPGLHLCSVCLFLLLFPSLCPSVLHMLSVFMLQNMHFWLIPHLQGCRFRMCRQTLVSVWSYDVLLAGLAWAGRGRRGDKKRRGEEGVGIEEGMHSSTSLWASLFLPLRRAILSKRLLFWTEKGEMEIEGQRKNAHGT